MIKQLLLTPGPTPVPARVLLTMAQPIIHHRTPQFSALFEEGLPQVYARHERMARATRAAAAALGLRLLAPESPSPATTGVHVPDGVDGGKLVSYLRDRMGVTFAGRQDRLKGRILRLAHHGYVGVLDVIAGIAALEMALAHFGHRVAFGHGVAAAEEVFMAALPA